MDLPFTTTMPVRFRDIDAMGHVNNAVYVTYLEQARVVFFEEALGLSVRDAGSVIASLSIDYERPIELGDEVSIGIGVGDIGRSSIPMTYEIRSNGDHAATAETVLVLIDTETGSSRRIPEPWREAITEYSVSDAIEE